MPSDIFLWRMISEVISNRTDCLHDVRLVHSSNALSAMRLSVVEGVACYPLRSIPGDQLD